MKKLLVLMSIAIFAIALSSCQKEAEMTSEPAPVVTEEAPAEQETPAVAEEAIAQPEKAAVVAEEKVVQKEQPEPAPSAVVEEVDLEAVVVTVNGQKITEKEVSEEVAKIAEMQKKRMPPGMELPDAMTQQIRNRVVDTKVQQLLLSQEAKKRNLSVSDEQVLEEIKKIAGQRDQSMEEVEAQVAQMGMTMDDLKGQIHSQMLSKVLMESLNPDAVVAEADAQKFYDDNPQHFENKEQVQASHILCGKRGITEEEYPAELEKIEAAKARLDAGEAFEDVAKDISTCPSKDKGGDLGFFGKGQMDPAFEKAAFELEVGQTTGIVKTSFGYHIIKLTDKKEAGKIPFEEVQERITEYLTQQKQKEFWTEYSKTIRDNAVIEYSAEEQALRDAAEEAAAARQQGMPIQVAPTPEPETTEAE